MSEAIDVPNLVINSGYEVQLATQIPKERAEVRVYPSRKCPDDPEYECVTVTIRVKNNDK